jgi:hypothetical protein
MDGSGGLTRKTSGEQLRGRDQGVPCETVNVARGAIRAAAQPAARRRLRRSGGSPG